ncbi:MAG: zinc-finger domain-containing protein [Legionella sp.]|jgi:uncharacterized Zn-finger protein|nr:zinc-finger domain-containing protein [Legionella sp.]
MIKVQHKPACTKKKQTVRREDLPLSCPMDEMALWNAHPKVYLPMGDDGTATCPYCGTLFVLKTD